MFNIALAAPVEVHVCEGVNGENPFPCTWFKGNLTQGAAIFLKEKYLSMQSFEEPQVGDETL